MAKVQPKTVSGFVRAGHRTKHRIIMATKALQKSGKSYFGLTMPGPLAVIALEPGLDGVIDHFQESKEIYVSDYVDEIEACRRALVEKNGNVDHAHDENMRAARDILNKIKSDYLEALSDSAIRSVFVDTGTELWRLVRLANLGKLEQVKGRYYGNANQEMLSFIRTAYSSESSVVFSHRLKKEYKDDKPSGNFEINGFGEMEFECQVVVQQWKDPDQKIPDRFGATVVDSRLDPQIEGQEFIGDTCNFPFVAATVFNEDPSEWE